MTVDSGDLYLADGGAEGGRIDKFDDSTSALLSQFESAPALTYLRQGIAVSHATGEVYVGADFAHTGEGAVAAYDSAGTLQKIWNGRDTPEAEGFGCFECNGPGSVAVDNNPSSLIDWASGDVYVAEPERNVVDVFKPKAGGEEEWVAQIREREPGVPLSTVFGVAVDPSDGDVLVVDADGVDEFEPTVLHQYMLVRRITETEAGHSFIAINGVTVDGGNGEIYVFDNGQGVLDQFDSSGDYVGRLLPAGRSFGAGVGAPTVDPTTHELYVADREGEGDYLVDAFGPSVVIPDVLSEAASSVQTTSATLNGTVSPAGVQLTDCHFAYGTSTAYGQSIPCAQTPAEIGAGSSPVAVSANLTGLAPGAIRHFRLIAGNANGSSEGQDESFGPPQIDGESASNETKTTATLEAQIDPNAVDTTYHFEYGTTTAYGTSVPVPDTDIGAGPVDQAASVELNGLHAGVTYHYRVVAVSSAGATDGQDETLSTVPPARVDSVTITNISVTERGVSASLHASIDPLGTATTYRFEYGTSTSYGTSVPVADAPVGSGTGDQSVTQQLTGLQENTTYHVRVTVTNAFGTERSGDHTFVYGTGQSGLPDNRAYELVTPVQKYGAQIGGGIGEGLHFDIAEDGAHVVFTSIQCFADAGACSADRVEEGDPYLSSRTPGGWVTTALAPPATQHGSNSSVLASPDAGTALFSVETPPLNEDDFWARGSNGAFSDVGPGYPPSDGARGDQLSLVLGSPDLSHVAWEAFTSWTSFDPTFNPAGTSMSAYEYVGAGNTAPQLVGVSGGPGSRDLISTCGAQLERGPGAMSTDGGTVFFTVLNYDFYIENQGPCASGTGANEAIPVPAQALYARIDESRTVLISGRSPADCTSNACLSSPPSNALFEGASSDGSKVFFTSTQQLTDSASEDPRQWDGSGGEVCAQTQGANGCNLYLYDFANPAGHNLIDVSAGATSVGGPQVEGVAAVSADGSHVYFVARGVLSTAANDQGQSATAGENNLYVYERDAAHPEGRTAFVATLAGSDYQQWEPIGREGHNANVTPDGRFLVFTSHGRLTDDDTSVSGAAQVFRYDAQTGELTRISIGDLGFNDNGNSAIASPCAGIECSENATIASPEIDVASGLSVSGAGRSDPTVSQDGAYVFFRSPLALAPGALNDVQIQTSNGIPSFAQNVYEYHAGRVYLISDGRDLGARSLGSDVFLLGTDATGKDVFFTTTDQLVAQDTDTELDIYDARSCDASEPCVTPPAPAAPCQGEACHGSSGGAPPSPSAATMTFSGPGNLVSPPAPAAHKKAVKRHVKRKSSPKRAKKKKRKARRAAGRAIRQSKRGRS